MTRPRTRMSPGGEVYLCMCVVAEVFLIASSEPGWPGWLAELQGQTGGQKDINQALFTCFKGDTAAFQRFMLTLHQRAPLCDCVIKQICDGGVNVGQVNSSSFYFESGASQYTSSYKKPNTSLMCFQTGKCFWYTLEMCLLPGLKAPLDTKRE